MKTLLEIIAIMAAAYGIWRLGYSDGRWAAQEDYLFERLDGIISKL